MDEKSAKIQDDKSLHEIAAKDQPHGEHGHFAPKSHTPAPPPASDHTNPVISFLRKESDVSTTHDDKTLLDVHIGNPLRRISDILEEIKRQKAFTFDIKGSLGAAGIVLVLTTFGIFGGTKAFCLKGEQFHIGRLTILNLPVEPPNNSLVAKLDRVWQAAKGQELPSEKVTKRFLLIEQNQTIYSLIGVPNIPIIEDISYIARGEVDTCSQTITLKSPEDLQAH